VALGEGHSQGRGCGVKVDGLHQAIAKLSDTIHSIIGRLRKLNDFEMIRVDWKAFSPSTHTLMRSKL